MATRIVTVTPGTPTRLDTDCPSCGWSDVWEAALHTLTPTGVGTLAVVRRCTRCATIVR